MSQLLRALFTEFTEHAQRLNLALTKDGTEPMTAPFPLWQVAVVDLPDEATWAGTLIYVTDESGGPTVAYSNGTNWKRVYDNATVT